MFDLKNPDSKRQLKELILNNVEGCKEVESINQLTGGASRQMYKADLMTEDGPRSIVLRMASENSSLAMDQLTMAQEMAVINAVLSAGVKTPAVVFQFTKADGLGEGFAIEFMQGESIGGRIAKSKKFEQARKVLSNQVAEALAGIHNTEIKSNGLESSLKTFTPDYELEKMYKAYLENRIDIPIVDYAHNWLKERTYELDITTLTHGDYRNGNFLVSEPDGLVCVLDWELGAISDPMRDLGYFFMQPWRYGVGHMHAGGFGGREEFIAEYEKASGIKVNPEGCRWWEVFGCFWWTIACCTMGLSYREGQEKLGDRIAIGRRHSEGIVDLANLIIPGKIDLVPPAPKKQDKELATLQELVDSSQKDIMNELLPLLQGRAKFVARVVLSNLGVASRDLAYGSMRDDTERKSIEVILNQKFDTILQAKSALCAAIREGAVLDKKALVKHLRESAVRQIFVDQPTYSGLAEALRGT